MHTCIHTFCLCSASATPYAAAKKAHEHAEERAASQPCSGAVCACVGMYDFARVCLARGTLTNPSASPVGCGMGQWGAGTCAEPADELGKRFLGAAPPACERAQRKRWDCL